MLAPGRHIASLLPAGTTLGLQAPLANWVAPGYASISGTSFSAPQVAAAASILFQLHPDWSPDAVKALLVKKGHSVKGAAIKALDVANAAGASSAGLANQGVPALVCAPGSTCLTGSTIASYWNSSSWTSSSWVSSSWTSSSWNSSSWVSSSWVSSSWVSSSWVSSSWTAGSWD
jgi:subtilisin family serine protease